MDRNKERRLIHPQQQEKYTAMEITDSEDIKEEQESYSNNMKLTTLTFPNRKSSQAGPSSLKIVDKHFVPQNRFIPQTKQKTITFGPNELPICTEDNKKFRPIFGMNLTEKQHCLLDNLWHIHTFPSESTKKVQILNSLGYYFLETAQKTPEKTYTKRFSHYIIFRGTKLGLFNKWETVVKHIQCTDPLYKGFYSFSEAMDVARKYFGLNNFFIEPEEVKTFSEIIKESPEQIIQKQEEVIANLQKHIFQKGKEILPSQALQVTQLQDENQKLKQEVFLLKNTLKNTVYRDFNSFKARILDIPWRQTLKPVLEKIEGLDDIISEKICTGFPIILYKLQQKIVQIVFKEIKYKGVTVVERLDEGKETGILLLQIDLFKTDMPQNLITQFYHYGMIDYIKFRLTPSTEKIINTFGEKFTIVAGNMATHSRQQKVGCKIFASFPEADSHTYRPARKRIFISTKTEDKVLLDMAVKIESHIDFSSLAWLHEQDVDKITDFHTSFIKLHQKTPHLPKYFPWTTYKLMAEGHYVQIWASENWGMLLPFVGEGDTLEEAYINDTDEENTWPYPCDQWQNDDLFMQDAQSEGDTIPTIDSTHRDF